MERYRVKLLHDGDVVWDGEVVSRLEEAVYDAYSKYRESGGSLPLIELYMKVTKLSSVVKVRKIPKKNKKG